MTYESLMLHFTFHNLEKYLEDNIKNQSTLSTDSANQLSVIIKKIEEMSEKSLFDHTSKVPVFTWMRMGMTLRLLLESNKAKLSQALSKKHEDPTKKSSLD
jgi:hypothetical protein